MRPGLTLPAAAESTVDWPKARGANTYYLLHFPLTLIVMAFAFWRSRTAVFVAMRNSLIGCTSVALAVHLVVPMVAGIIHPLLTSLVVIVTGHHFVSDVAIGAGIGLAALTLTTSVATAKPASSKRIGVMTRTMMHLNTLAARHTIRRCNSAVSSA